MLDQERYTILGRMIEEIRAIKPLTLGELREATRGLPDDTQVLLAPSPANSYADWFNVDKNIGLPNGDDSEYLAVTLYPVDNYDSRQF